MSKRKTYYFSKQQRAFFDLFMTQYIRVVGEYSEAHGGSGGTEYVSFEVADIRIIGRDDAILVDKCPEGFRCFVLGTSTISVFKTFRAVQNFVSNRLTM